MEQTKMRKNIYYLKFIADTSNQKHECDLMTTVLIVQDSNAEELYTHFVKTAITEFKKLYEQDILSKDIQWKVINLIDSCESLCDINDIEFVVEHQSPVDGCYYWLQFYNDTEPINLAIYSKSLNKFQLIDLPEWIDVEDVYKWFPQAVKKPSSNQLSHFTTDEKTTNTTQPS